MAATNEQFLALADEVARELLDIEQSAAVLTTADLRNWLAQVKVMAEEQWPGDDAPDNEKIAVGLNIATRIERSMWVIDAGYDTLAQITPNAARAGANAATRMAELSGVTLPEKTAEHKAITKVVEKQKAQLQRAKKLALLARTIDDITLAADLALSVVPRVDGTARWAVADAYHTSLETTAKQDPTLRLVWRAERDACLQCLRYQGLVTKPGKGYPAGLTFGDNPNPGRGTTTPPLHPRCRCEQIVWKETSGAVTLPDALKREAQRSVLRGWGDASNPAKARAAKRLLDQGVKAPASVLAAARALALRYGA